MELHEIKLVINGQLRPLSRLYGNFDVLCCRSWPGWRNI